MDANKKISTIQKGGVSTEINTLLSSTKETGFNVGEKTDYTSTQLSGVNKLTNAGNEDMNIFTAKKITGKELGQDKSAYAVKDELINK